MAEQDKFVQPVPATLIINGQRYITDPEGSEREAQYEERGRLVDSLRAKLKKVTRENVRLQTQMKHQRLLVRESSRMVRENRIFHEMLSKLHVAFPGHGTSQSAMSGQLCLGYINRLCQNIVTRAQCKTIEEPPAIFRRYKQIEEPVNIHLESSGSESPPGGAVTPLMFTSDDASPTSPILRRRGVAARHAVHNQRPTQGNPRMIDHSQTVTAINTIRRATSLIAAITPGNPESDHNYVLQNYPDVQRQFHQSSPEGRSQLLETITID